MRESVTDLAAIAAEIARIRALAPDALGRRWRAVFGRKPPAGLSRELLGRMIAMRIQEQAFGGLDRDSVAFWTALPATTGHRAVSSSPALCSFASIRASATPSRRCAMASTGR